MNTIKKIVMTGGPCSGKSTILDALLSSDLAPHIELVPEVATILLGGGFPLPGRDLPWSPDWQLAFQQAVVTTQVSLERASALKADDSGKRLLVCDRGLFDGPGYMNCVPEEFCRLCHLDLSARDEYSAVLHLESLAVSQPEEYDRLRLSNSARYETAVEAKDVDDRLWQSWSGHSRQIKIGCGPDLAIKTEQVMAVIRQTLEEGE